MSERPADAPGIPVYVRIAKWAFVLVLAILAVAGGFTIGLSLQLSVAGGLATWLGRARPHDRNLLDQRNLLVLFFNLAFALFVFAFFPEPTKYWICRWLVLAIAIYGAAVLAIVGRRQKKMNG